MSQIDQLIYFPLLSWFILILLIYYIVVFWLIIPLVYFIMNFRYQFFYEFLSNNINIKILKICKIKEKI